LQRSAARSGVAHVAGFGTSERLLFISVRLRGGAGMAPLCFGGASRACLVMTADCA